VRSARSTAVISDNRQRRDLFADALAGAKGRLNPKGILNPGVLLPAPA
jgi:FAD/FMN-containing dehydrogenase